jgi:hypothetical protein
MENKISDGKKDAGGERGIAALFRDGVSDSILGRRSWRLLQEEEKRRLKLDEHPILLHEPVSFWSFDLLKFDLPFYPNTHMLEIRCEYGISPIWCLERDGVIFRLDGDVGRQLYDIAEIAPLTLTPDNLLEYLRFFCFFMNGDAGPFFIVDGLDHPVFDAIGLTAEELDFLEKRLTRPQVSSASDEGTYTVRASVVYADKAFNVTFQVHADGAVEMKDDKGIAGELPVRLLKPGYRIGSTS